MKNIVNSLNTKLMEKGKEINAYKDMFPGSFVVGGGGGGGHQHPEKIVEEDEDAENKPAVGAVGGAEASVGTTTKATGILS